MTEGEGLKEGQATGYEERARDEMVKNVDDDKEKVSTMKHSKELVLGQLICHPIRHSMVHL